MRKACHRITCPPAPRRWTLGLALCALLACTLSIPDLASGAEGSPGPVTTDMVETETGATNEALPMGEDAPAATTPATAPTPATEPVTHDPASGDSTAGGTAAEGTTAEGTTAGGAGDPATQLSQDGVGTSPNGPNPTVSAGRLLVTLPWGTGPGEVGLVRGTEGLSRGPEALAIAPDGRMVVLDSVNRRLVVLSPEGQYLATLELRLSEPRFLAVDGQGIYVLDCDADRQLVCLDWSGAEWARFALPPLEEVVTALLLTESGPCLETGHDQVFLLNLKSNLSKSIVSGKSVPASLQTLGGRPLDKALQRVAKITYGRTAGLRIKSFKVDRKTLRPTLIATVDARLTATQALEHLVSADPLASGELVIGARLVQKKGSLEDQPALILGRLAVTEQGRPEREAGSLLFLDDQSIAYVGLPYVVAPDGRVLQPRATAEGYSILVHEFPTATQGLTTDTTAEEATP